MVERYVNVSYGIGVVIGGFVIVDVMVSGVIMGRVIRSV